MDARKLAELLRGNQLHPVYHGEHGVRTLKELGRSYLTITQDVTRVMNRIKALYRSWAIPCAGATVYAPRRRAEWLARSLNQEFGLRGNRPISNWICCNRYAWKRDASLSAGKPQTLGVKLLRQIPSIGPILLRPCRRPCCRLRTVSEPSDNSGPRAVSPSRRMTAVSTARCAANCNATASA